MRISIRRRVVVVDDAADSATALALLLQLEGCDVRTFTSADGVLQEALAFRPHVVFVDLALGEGPSGLDLARQLRQRPELRDVLIAAVTGWGRPQDRLDAHAAGIDCFHVKPFDIDELVGVVRSLDCDRLVA